jgi:hypothetical protein
VGVGVGLGAVVVHHRGLHLLQQQTATVLQHHLLHLPPLDELCTGIHGTVSEDRIDRTEVGKLKTTGKSSTASNSIAHAYLERRRAPGGL